MKKVLVSILFVLITGCSTSTTNTIDDGIPKQPSTDWISENIPKYQKAAENNPTKKNIEAYEHLKALSMSRTLNEANSESKLVLLNRDLTLSWGNIGRGGAAIRQPGYIQVLGQSNISNKNTSTKLNKQVPSSLQNNIQNELISDAISKIKESNESSTLLKSNHGYSVYELSRWERFCSAGSVMNEKDWLFINNEMNKKTPIPKQLISDCVPPEHSYDEYKSAWVKHCNKEEITNKERTIIKNSIRPQSISCSNLN